MKRVLSFLIVCATAVALIFFAGESGARSEPEQRIAAQTYLGFDLNIFPGTNALPVLRKTFAFGGYWLSPPPGEKSNSWSGKREEMREQQFGFLLLYLGRESRELRNLATAREKGSLDARNAAAAAKKDRFPAQAILFLDIEEGGRLPETYHAYLQVWAKQLEEAGYRAGAYCSGMPVREGPDATITTADDIRAHAPSQDFTFYVFNDACPPSLGCVFSQAPSAPANSGIPFAALWQFAQSPRRKQFTAHCAPGYSADGNCYAPGDSAHAWLLDVDSATSADPSNGM
ncbi:MAG: glycoside hydrolase domain-containing protein [Candidatus Acidiferrum sp.]